MRQRLAAMALLFSIVGLPVSVTALAEQLGDLSRLPTLAVLATPAIAALTLDGRKPHQKPSA